MITDRVSAPTSVQTRVDLSSIPADAFRSGDQGFVHSEIEAPHGPLYVFVRASYVPVNGTTVLAVRYAPLDRWISLSLLIDPTRSIRRLYRLWCLTVVAVVFLLIRLLLKMP